MAAGVVGVRRRGILTRRAVTGGFLVAVAAVVVFAAALSTAGKHARQYVVAARSLAQGTVIGPGDLTTASVRLPSGAAAEAFLQSAQLIGRTAMVNLTPGELIESSMLTDPGATPPLRPVTVPVDPDSVSGLGPGDRVDVLATTSSGGSGNSSAGGSGQPASGVTVVVRGASLIGVSRSSPGLLSGSSSATLATIGVADLTEVEAVVGAAHTGSVVLVQAEPSDGVGPGPGTP